jgi:hypothetical protein
MANKLKISGSLIINGVTAVTFPDVDINYTPNVDMDVELELVHGPGGPVLRPKTPPRL